MVQSLQGLWEQNYDSLSEGQKKIVNLSVVKIRHRGWASSMLFSTKWMPTLTLALVKTCCEAS